MSKKSEGPRNKVEKNKVMFESVGKKVRLWQSRDKSSNMQIGLKADCIITLRGKPTSNFKVYFSNLIPLSIFFRNTYMDVFRPLSHSTLILRTTMSPSVLVKLLIN